MDYIIYDLEIAYVLWLIVFLGIVERVDVRIGVFFFTLVLSSEVF